MEVWGLASNACREMRARDGSGCEVETAEGSGLWVRFIYA